MEEREALGWQKPPTMKNKWVWFSPVNNAFLNCLDWKTTIHAVKFNDYNQFCAQVESGYKTFHPLALTMRGNVLDNPKWNQAMNGLEREGDWESMELKLETLLGKNAWTKVDQTRDMNVVTSTLASKCKWFLDGLVQKSRHDSASVATIKLTRSMFWHLCPGGCMASHMPANAPLCSTEPSKQAGGLHGNLHPSNAWWRWTSLCGNATRLKEAGKVIKLHWAPWD